MLQTVFKPFDQVLVRNSTDETWRAEIFQRYVPRAGFQCLGGVYNFCCLFAGNETLCDTSNLPVGDCVFGTHVRVWNIGQTERKEALLLRANVLSKAGRKYAVVLRDTVTIRYFDYCELWDWPIDKKSQATVFDL